MVAFQTAAGFRKRLSVCSQRKTDHPVDAERIAQQMPDVSLTLKVDSGQACIDAVRDSSCDVALTQAISPQGFSDLQVYYIKQHGFRPSWHAVMHRLS